MAYSPWTLEEIQDNLNTWKQAYQAAASNKSYTIDGRTLTRQDIATIKKELAYWQDELANINGQRINRVMRVMPRDL